MSAAATTLELTAEQQRMLDGGRGQITARLMRLLVRLGQVYGARRMIPVGSVQVSGISYKSIGDPGLEFLEDLAAQGARVQVLTTLNPAGMDLEAWRELGFDEGFARKQRRIIAALTTMGATPSVTCTPYLVGNLPRFGEHLAWAESSAVSFANSVIGARSNREGGPSALAAAVCGCTPDHGLHRDENRRPTVVVELTAELRSRADFGALGHHVGALVGGGVPYFRGVPPAGVDHLKGLGAAMAASGAVAMYHAEGLTPEAALASTDGCEVLTVGREDLEQTRARLNTGARPDLIALGCPHASLDEIARLAGKLKGRTLNTPVWICTARVTRDTAARMGLVQVIEQAGGRVVADTCMVVAPTESMGFETTGVTSGKAAAYMPGFCGQQVVFGDLDQLLQGCFDDE